ncbi:MAG TPA: signal recognition particle-docking protein FtsY [Nitrospiria bacterium]|nr:signal recognition particle-docking protein FtsY [Nitrospiria bacterium]
MIGGMIKRFGKGLTKTRNLLTHGLDQLSGRSSKIDADLLSSLEELLLSADVGVHVAERLVGDLREKVLRREVTDPKMLRTYLIDAVLAMLSVKEGELHRESPWVVLFVGVNGVGKTTTVAKVAGRAVQEGKKVMMVAGDTFRAAAIDQLSIWGERVGAQVISHKPGADPSAVAFDAVTAARARGTDLVLVDTAGRLHTRSNLMEEIKKIKRVIGKAMPGAPHEILLVLDATTGQNALSQARLFHEALDVTGIALTKLDGTAKGGIVIPIMAELAIPVRYVGVGETSEDLVPFDPVSYVNGLFKEEEGSDTQSFES